MNKKGVSEVVSTVLIILISVVAVVIIASVILPMIRNQLTSSQQCFGTVGQLMIVRELTCYNSSGSLNVGVQNNREGDIKITGVKISYGAGTQSVTAPEAGAFKTYTIEDVASSPTMVQIAPLVSSSGKNKTCDISDSLNSIPEC